MTGELYFYMTGGLYQPGDQVMPGNWGRVIQGIGPGGGSYYREFAFEAVRRAEFPSRVSRLDAAFVFVAAAAADLIRPQRPNDLVYSVTLQEGARSDLLDMSWLDVVLQFRTYEGVENCIRSYWRGEIRDPQFREVLTDSPLTIVQRLNVHPDEEIGKA